MGRIQELGEIRAIELLAKGDMMGAINSLEQTCHICLSRNAMPRKDALFCDRCNVEALTRHLKGEDPEAAPTSAIIKPVEKQRWSETKVIEQCDGIIVKKRIVRTTTRYRIDTIVKEEEVETYYQFSPNGPKWIKYQKKPKKIKRRQYVVDSESKQ